MSHNVFYGLYRSNTLKNNQELGTFSTSKRARLAVSLLCFKSLCKAKLTESCSSFRFSIQTEWYHYTLGKKANMSVPLKLGLNTVYEMDYLLYVFRSEE